MVHVKREIKEHKKRKWNRVKNATAKDITEKKDKCQKLPSIRTSYVLPSHREGCAELQAVDPRSGKTLSPFQRLLCVLQPHYHEVVEHMLATDPPLKNTHVIRIRVSALTRKETSAKQKGR